MASEDGVAINVDGGFAAAYYNRGHSLVHTPHQLYGIILPTPDEIKEAERKLESAPLDIELIDEFPQPMKIKDTIAGKKLRQDRDAGSCNAWCNAPAQNGFHSLLFNLCSIRSAMDTNYGMEIVRATEIAALTAARLQGLGDHRDILNQTRKAITKTLNRLSIEGVLINDRFVNRPEVFQLPEIFGKGGEKTDLMTIALEAYHSRGRRQEQFNFLCGHRQSRLDAIGAQSQYV